MNEEQDNKNNEIIEIKKSEYPDHLPTLPLRNMVVFPQMMVPLTIGRESSLKLIDDVASGDKLLLVSTQLNSEQNEPGFKDLYNMGTICRVLRMVRYPNNTAMAVVQGLSRATMIKVISEKPYLDVLVEPKRSLEGTSDVELEALVKQVTQKFQDAANLAQNVPKEAQSAMINISDPGHLADFIAAQLDIKIEEKQNILETLDVRKRLFETLRLLEHELEILEVGSRIHSEVKGEIDRSMQERYLREQMEAIRRELGEGDNPEMAELAERIKKAKMPVEVRQEAERELDRLAQIFPTSPEYTVIRTYLDWLVSLPWKRASKDKLDLTRARKILDRDHYDLEKVKQRLLEYIAVLKLTQHMKGPILCFVGPPGVGKTSLGQSIARALGRKFVRMSLGGMRDEAEIRGHRRTYIGALPGRIIQGIKRANTRNPVFMLDEIDKLGMDFRGDPASALLEVLDPEQNNTFSDHYLDVPFDLSQVMFVTTANSLEAIPLPLLDRMEIIELPGYTEVEKLMIAKNYLLPRQLKAHGLNKRNLKLKDDAILALIQGYTREAGVRNLERELANICRKVAFSVVSGDTKSRTIGENNLSELLKSPRFFPEMAERTSRSGVAVGLVWTPVGGDILFIEATRMKGKGKLLLTGKLGEVMQESAQAALSIVRSKAPELDIDPELFDRIDIHIHVPAGAIPKDGPSAGVTLVTVLLSLLLDRPVVADLAMTGEITLRGVVLPVGGVRDKVLAAHRAGVKRVILPYRNENDLEEVAPEVRKELEFHFVESIDEVIQLALDLPVPVPV